MIVAIGTAGETACPTLLDQSFGEVGGAGSWFPSLIQIPKTVMHPGLAWSAEPSRAGVRCGRRQAAVGVGRPL